MSIVMLEKQLQAEDLFSELNPEDERQDKDFKVDTSRINELLNGLESIIRTPYPKYKDYRYYGSGNISGFNPSEIIYAECEKQKHPNITRSNIRNLMIALKAYEEKFLKINPEEKWYKKIGLYLSHLINNSVDNDIVIPTNHLSFVLGHLGYRNNGRKIKINGDVGSCAGNLMLSGEILISGNAADNLGLRMKNGTIKVRNTAQRVGQDMENGEIYVYGFAREGAALGLQGGLIYIEKGIASTTPFLPTKSHKYGDGTGDYMTGGLLSIAGNVGSQVGKHLNGGKINIDGNVLACGVGNYMKSGEIYISGNVRGTVGDGMTGGTIKIDGKSFPVSKKIRGGDIYHKDRQIVKDGRKVGGTK